MATGRDPQIERRSPRVGPFEGRRLGALTVPLRIHDLSVGGCLVEAHYDQTVGRRIQMEIELPHEGWVTLEGDTLYIRPDFGFAVKFVDMGDETRGRLERVIARVLTAHPTHE